ncbi:MAG TPA: YraN family protein [Thermoflexales bacterium]|nr:YraN family protein [Thermoflexales bacterium]HQW36124.1 YraN family protein [Thermoflexales bacterium]HQZ21503.1 YraN family protein [Thermoflexales bacterium]HQZ98804.1 YraN family protein [Thermoflexales bacterium]
MAKPTRKEIGAHGEALAERHLLAGGYAIRHKNWRSGHGELDIVAEREGVIVFVEVRARTSDAFGTPEETLTPRKKAKLMETAQAYLRDFDLEDAICRMDVIAIDLDHHMRVVRLTQIESAIE